MTDCNINGLQSTYTNSAFSEVGVGINEDLKLAEHADQQITEVSVNDRAQVGAAAFGQIAFWAFIYRDSGPTHETFSVCSSSSMLNCSSCSSLSC